MGAKQPTPPPPRPATNGPRPTSPAPPGEPAKSNELHLYSSDSPRRPGHKPKFGDQDWVIDIPLHDGRRLFLSVGKVGHDALRDVFAEEAADLKPRVFNEGFETDADPLDESW